MNARRGTFGFVVVLTLISLILATSGCDTTDKGGAATTAPKLLLGAHYYAWYPENLRQGFLREKLSPPQNFLLGTYDSGDARVAMSHIEWARSHGIDFFTIDWWPRAADRRANIDGGFLKAPNIGNIKFCMFYESGDLGFTRVGASIPFTPEVRRRFVDELVEIARSYFDHPSYLKIDGRPVLVLYITRTFTGDFAEAIAEARARIRELGHDAFLIGDEIFWLVTGGDGAFAPNLTDEPQRQRIRLFDAITAYNFYEGAFEFHSGYGAESSFVPDVNDLLKRYRTAAGSVPILPSIIPGYNDRGVRLKEDHFPIPRQWSRDAADGTFLAEMFRRVLVPNLDERLPIGFITSFNEWNEDTGIEPVEFAPHTTDDESGRDAFTGGYRYEGHGFEYLETLRTERRRAGR